MHIVSASRRTDIPAFYAPWFLNRLRAGFCEVFNPFGGGLRRVSLLPGECAGFVFWTRHAAPLAPALVPIERAGFRFYFQYTITGYGPPLETRNPETQVAVRTFRMLADRISPGRVHWRYDPLVLSSATPAEYHLRRFERLARELEGATRRCYFSFVDYYGKTRRNLARIAGAAFTDPAAEQRVELVAKLDALAAAHGITLYSCCEPELAGGRVQPARCVDSELLGLGSGFRARPTREGCGCVESVDIGAYDTCRFGCAYCYATSSREAAARRAAAHDSETPALWRPAGLTTPPPDGPSPKG
ncbi:MAG: DUF1848 domain-containing protein [Bryobacteraceae bacterium]